MSDFHKRVSSREFERKYLEEVKSARPVHPDTGEEGTFLKFIAGGGYRRPVYVTLSGKKFSPPDNIDEIFKKHGATSVLLDDHGFFESGDESAFDNIPKDE